MSGLKEAARKGEAGDTRLGHLTNGDRIFPAEHVDDETAKMIDMFMKKKGLDPGRFTVGHPSNRKNRRTRLPQFEGTGGAGSGEGPGSDGGTGGNGPGGGGTGGPGNGASAGGDAGTGTSGASGLTGMESQTAVESGQIPGTPNAQAEMNSPAAAAAMGQLGKFGQPDLGVIGNVLGNVVGKPLGDIGRNPISSAINFGVGMIPGIGQALSLGNMVAAALGQGTIGSAVTGLGRGLGADAPTGPATGPGATTAGGGGSSLPPFSDYLTSLLQGSSLVKAA